MNFYYRWKAKREFKKSLALIEKFCDNAPTSFFKGLIRNADGTEVDPVDARNILLRNAYMFYRSI